MKRYTVIRYGRIALQTAIIAAITVAIAAGMSCVFSRMQIVPAILACSTTWLILWIVATLVFGRIYCSTVCPVGTLTDLSAWLTRRKKHYSYCSPYRRVRISVLAITAVCSLAGVTAVLSILDPYSAFSRVVTAITRPVAAGLAGLVIAAATLTAIVVTAHRRGRLICNTVCPVGTLLGGVSKISLYHADINTDLCTNCGKCADRCPSQCINLTDHTVDVSRCTVCFDCMAVCPDNAITYRRGRHQLAIPMMQRVAGSAGVSSAMAKPDETPSAIRPVDRRTFLLAVAGAAGVATQSFASAANPRYVNDAVRLVPLNHVTPPGSPSRDLYLHRCTACGACIAACPTGVLTSSVKQFGIRHTLTPVMDFDKAYCRIDCVKCTEVCPTKALRPLTSKEKRETATGKARICVTNCMLYVNGTDCNVCAKACPKRAISICPTSDGRMMPQVEPELCIGCGRCANTCPTQPYRAIVIEGL